MATKPSRRRAPELPSCTIPQPFESGMWFVYSAMLGFFFLAVSLDNKKFLQELFDWPGVFAASPAHTTLLILRAIFFVECILLAFRWFHATKKQALMWVMWLDYKQPPNEADAAMWALALFIGILLAFTERVVFISGFLTSTLLLNYYTQWLCDREVEDALVFAKERFASDARRMKILESFEWYWVEPGQLGRLVVMMFVASIAFALALAGFVNRSEPASIHFYIAAYALLAIDILIGEAVVFFWRRQLDRKIEEAWCSESEVLQHSQKEREA